MRLVRCIVNKTYGFGKLPATETVEELPAGVPEGPDAGGDGIVRDSVSRVTWGVLCNLLTLMGK
jgi:hypothetical protein